MTPSAKMSHLLLLLLIITLTKSETIGNSTLCNGFQANFDLKSIMGNWRVVAIIPEKLFPDKEVTCYRVEFSETDGAGLRWLVNKTLESPPRTPLLDDIKGTIIRQRYYSEQAFDVWSKSIDGVNGCFQMVLTLNIGVNEIHKALPQDAMMQLHLMEADDGAGPFLVQMLWGRLISVVIYRRTQGVTQNQLKPVFELMNKLRGPQRLPMICDNRLQDILIF